MVCYTLQILRSAVTEKCLIRIDISSDMKFCSFCPRTLWRKLRDILSCQPSVTATSCFVYNCKVNSNLYTPLELTRTDRIGLIHKWSIDSKSLITCKQNMTSLSLLAGRTVVSLLSVLRGVWSVVCVVVWSWALRGFALPHYYVYWYNVPCTTVFTLENHCT